MWYHVTSLLMEVPTGVVADIWGRRASRIAGRCTAVLAYAIMFFSQSFPLQAFAFAATALGNNLESGAGDALVYDSLLILNEENRYMHVAGRQELVYQLTSILTFMLGGYFALHSYALVFGLSMGFCSPCGTGGTGFQGAGKLRCPWAYEGLYSNVHTNVAFSGGSGGRKYRGVA